MAAELIAGRANLVLGLAPSSCLLEFRKGNTETPEEEAVRQCCLLEAVRKKASRWGLAE